MKKALAILLICLLPWGRGVGGAAERTILDLSYEGIIRYAEERTPTKSELASWGRWVREQQKKDRAQLDAQLEALRQELKQVQKALKASVEPSNDTRCKAIGLERRERELQALRRSLVKVRFQNRTAKLELLRRWPAERTSMEREILTGAFLSRPHADADDIGARPANVKGQWRDQRLGQEAWDELKAQGALPPELEEEARLDLLAAEVEVREASEQREKAGTPEELESARERETYAKAWYQYALWYHGQAVYVKGYLSELAELVRRHSDMRVPARLYVLRTPEVNAFALPGGIVGLNTGLLWTGRVSAAPLEPILTEESQLAGILAHEYAHVSERHWRDIRKWATILSVSAQVAIAIIYYKLTKNSPYITTTQYYAMQGAQMLAEILLALGLLKVSRGAEAESDQLAVQTLWHGGYDPLGFFRAFDRIASYQGVSNTLGWFRSHPPDVERMLASKRETTFLEKYPMQAPTKVVDTQRFQAMREVLRNMLERRDAWERTEGRRQGMPSLQFEGEGCKEETNARRT